MLSDFIKNIVSVFISEIRFAIMELIHRKHFKFRGIQRFSPYTEVSIDSNAFIEFGNRVRAHTGTRIRARKGAKIIIGDDVAFNYNCILTAYNEINIGNGCEIGPGVLFYDHDHDFHGRSIKEKKFRKAPIKIGKNVWIGANSIILRGTTIGDNCVIGAGTVVCGNKEYPKNSLIKNNIEIIYNRYKKDDNNENNVF